MRLRRTPIITLVFALTLLGLTPATAQSDVDHVDYKHSVVQIGSITLRPQAKRVPKENALAWLNYTPYVARIVFDRVASGLPGRNEGGSDAFEKNSDHHFGVRPDATRSHTRDSAVGR